MSFTSELPKPWGWVILAAAALVLAIIVGSGVWFYLDRQREAGYTAYGRTIPIVQAAVGKSAGGEQRQAVQALEEFLRAWPRHPAAGPAWYELASLHAQGGAWDQAIHAYGEAARRARGSLQALSQLGLGYAYEAKQDYGRALSTFQEALKGKEPKAFLYGELLLSQARAQEALDRKAEALESYRRFLKDLPTAPQAPDIKGRIASLETNGQARP
jgi:tetratricopeptide (TPR) repeat protein